MLSLPFLEPTVSILPRRVRNSGVDIESNGKLIVFGQDRNDCLAKLDRALDEFVIEGVETTLPLFKDLLRNNDIQEGNYNIHWLENWLNQEKK